MVYMMEGCTVKWVSSECWAPNTSYYTSKRCMITSPMTSLSMCKRPVGGPLPRSRNAKFATRDLNRGVVKSTNINTDLFVLNFGMNITYIYTTLSLQFWPSMIYSSSPVRSEFGERWPWFSEWSEFPWSLPHLGILGAKVIETWTHSTKFQKLVYWCILWIQILNIQ